MKTREKAEYWLNDNVAGWTEVQLNTLTILLNQFAFHIKTIERERCCEIVDVPIGVESWEIRGGQETIDVLRELVEKIRMD